MWINFQHHHQIYQAHFPSCSMFKISVISSKLYPLSQPVFPTKSTLVFWGWKISTPTLSLAPFRRLKLLEEKLRFIGESSQSWAALKELEWLQNGGNSENPIFGRKGWWLHPTWNIYWLNWIISSPKIIKGENKTKLGNLEFRTSTHHVPILLIW